MTNAIKREVINFGLSTIRNLVSILWFAIWYRVFSIVKKSEKTLTTSNHLLSVPGRFHCNFNPLRPDLYFVNPCLNLSGSVVLNGHDYNQVKKMT